MRKHWKITRDEVKNKKVIKFLVGHRIKFQSKCQIISKKQKKIVGKWMLG